MKLTLTKEETILLWQAGDYLDVVSGKLNITGKTERDSYTGTPARIQFLFERSDTDEVHDLRMYASCNVLNGPALLLRYCRPAEGTQYYFDALGLVSLVNRSWGHAHPLERVHLMKQTKRFTQLLKGQNNLFVRVAGGLFIGGIDSLREEGEVGQIYSALRKLMNRLAKNAEQYWNNGETIGSVSGKL